MFFFITVLWHFYETDDSWKHGDSERDDMVICYNFSFLVLYQTGVLFIMFLFFFQFLSLLFDAQLVHVRAAARF